jgi:hypothetical protein
MKWKLRLVRDMAQEAFVVIQALTSEEAEAIFWRDMHPDLIRWSIDDVMGDPEVMEICPAGDKDELTPLGRLPARQLKELTYQVSWAIEVEADTPLCAARRARFYQTQPGTVTYEVSEVRLRAAQRYVPLMTIDLPRTAPKRSAAP